MAGPEFFPRRGHPTRQVAWDPDPRLPRAAKNAGPAILRCRFGPTPPHRAGAMGGPGLGAAPARLRFPIASKAAIGAAVRRKETTHGDQRHQPP
jgi:hypothetical protein